MGKRSRTLFSTAFGRVLKPSAKPICSICGVRVATTRDHIPPKAILVKPYPNNLITVPACGVCNNGAAPMDEQFRVYLAATVGDKSESARKLWKDRSLATLRKNRKLVTALSSSMQELEIRTPSGVCVGKRTAYLWPAPVFESVVGRIARGLYFHHFGEVLGSRAVCSVGFLYELPDALMTDTADWPYSHVGDAFAYRFGRAAEQPLNSLWILEFYQGHWASVETKEAST